MTKVGVAIITHRAVALLPHCIPPLLQSPIRPRVLVVNSSSADGTVDLARQMGTEVLIVPRNEFNHGTTRELARRALGTTIVVMMTPDAKPQGTDMLANLVRPVAEGMASVSYARQVPHAGAGFFESFPRHFNYPAESSVRTIDDVKLMGPQTFFCSNVCAAWSNRALDEIGGFSHTLSLEDVIATAKLLHAGHRIAYCADAIVAHSHRYTLAEEFRRQFDTGHVRALHREKLFESEGDERRGVAYARGIMRQLLTEQPWLSAYGAAHVAVKYFGYLIGYHGHGLPISIRRLMSAQDYYWKGSVTSHKVTIADPQPRVVV